MHPDKFQRNILSWFATHGRTNLPWQQAISPYRVWVSEIMLQQTQVITVIPYFQRFMEHFPSVASLANAELDQVLHLWTGLGYYARARNLHKTATVIHNDHNDTFPETVETLSALPGIGQSTAGAILTIASNKRAAILDGNVKRVLARFAGIEGWPGQTSVANALWSLAERYTPNKKLREYTQAMMDLGATVCTRTKPLCNLCPLQGDCYAYENNQTHLLPTKKPKKVLPVKSTTMLMIINQDNHILLEQRPPHGIWGGLWSFPESDSDKDIENECRKRFHIHQCELDNWTPLRHTFSHFHLEITPIAIKAHKAHDVIMASDSYMWYNMAEIPSVGLAKPVKNLLAQLSNNLLTASKI